jgi:ABC-type nitrate/sulfonate/bicarbonate transport system permease component
MNRERWVPAIIILLVLGVWEWLADSGHISMLFYPSPLKIVQTLWTLAISGDLGTNLEVTLVRLGLGLVFGMIPGVVLGLSMGWSPRLRFIVDPFIAAFHPIPKTAIFPLIMIIIGIGEPSKIVTIAIATFFPALINSMAGVRQINPVYFEVAQNYGAKIWKTFTRVILPGSLPMVLAGTRIAFNNALVLTIAVELLVARQGLGVMIWFAWETLRTQNLYATLVTIAAIGIAANFLLQKISIALVPWSNHSFQDEVKSS